MQESVRQRRTSAISARPASRAVEVSTATARYPTTVRLRLLTERDLPDLMALKTAAGWNQTEEDWLLFFEYDRNGCFGIEVNGGIVASSTAMCYGHELAWIGMVLTL